MRLYLSALILPLLAGTAMAEPTESPGEAPDTPAGPFDNARLLSGPPAPANCRDRIQAVRNERGLPELRRDNARPGAAEELMFLALDHTIEGCNVLVMADDPRDVRPLPAPDDGRLLRQVPAR